jgi:hypothetical protein
MTTQLLIYETAVPVSSARHGKCSVEVSNYSFSRNVNSVPLVAAEFPEASTEYAIVFAGNADEVIPVVILGAREKENVYVTAQGSWQAKYIPAFIRRYPFVFSRSEDAKTFTLCVDEAFQGLNYQGHGKTLFTEEGKPSPYVEAVLNFLQEYGAQASRTQAFCKRLVELKLLEPMQAQITLATGEKMTLSGFMAVDRKKLKELSGQALADMVKTDELELLYLHLQSMRNFMAVKDRLVSIQGPKADDGTGAESPTEGGAGRPKASSKKHAEQAMAE